MKSFLQGKNTLSIPALRPPSSAAAPANVSCATSRPAVKSPGHSHAHAPASGNATVEVVKEGDKVVRLIVICGCGERVEVECLYPAGS